MDYAEERFSSHRIIGIAAVVLVHVAVIAALLSGLGEQAVKILQHPTEVKIIQPVKPPPMVPPPPPPPQFLQPPPPYIPPPLIKITQPPPAPVIAEVTPVKPVTPPPRPVPTPPATRRAAGLDPTRTCSAPQYPPDAEDAEETGTSILQFLIGTNGAVVGAQVASSSGYSVLDDAALQALSLCKFKPAIGADGNPQEAWTRIRYVWQLN